MDSEVRQRHQLALSIAREAGQLALQYFQDSDLVVDRKSDNSPVTIADREAEQLLRSRITSEYPDDAIVGEEFGEREGRTGFRWILDPIDGTKSFISGVPLFGTLVGIERDRVGVAGVIDLPGLRECVHAVKGEGAWHIREGRESVRAMVSGRKLEDGLFVTSAIDTYYSRDAQQAFERLQQAAYITRTWGDCYGYVLVATARAEVMVDPILNLWDAAAIQPILEEAGGTFTDWQGEATIYSGEAVATNGRVLDEVLQIIRPFSRRT